VRELQRAQGVESAAAVRRGANLTSTGICDLVRDAQELSAANRSGWAPHRFGPRL
jgi:hypothetical protein